VTDGYRWNKSFWWQTATTGIKLFGNKRLALEVSHLVTKRLALDINRFVTKG